MLFYIFLTKYIHVENKVIFLTITFNINNKKVIKAVLCVKLFLPAADPILITTPPSPPFFLLINSIPLKVPSIDAV